MASEHEEAAALKKPDIVVLDSDPMDSEPEEAPALKKPRLMVKVKSLTFSTRKNISPRKVKNAPRGSPPLPAIEKKEHDNEGFNSSMSENETKKNKPKRTKKRYTMKSFDQQYQVRLFRFMHMNKPNDKTGEESEELDKENKQENNTLEGRESHKAKEKSKLHSSRFLQTKEENDMDEDLDEIDTDKMESDIVSKPFEDEYSAEEYNPAKPGCSKTPDSPTLSIPGRRRYINASDDSETDGEEGSLQATRKANKARMRAIMEALRDPELEEKFASSQSKKGKSLKYGSAPVKGKRKHKATTFRFTGSIPTERRYSSRLQNKKPEYAYDVLDQLPDTTRQSYFKRPDYNIDDYSEDLEKIVYKPTRKSTGKRKIEEHIIIPVKDVTQEMLNNIALMVKGKVYSENGTTCHQCRQKTMDQKTCCRNPECSGMLGMFCGVCIKNRYGEDAAETLLNPNWFCPVCRGRCNCSICRKKQGKRPTGVLAPLALQNGYESVDHFLVTLRGEGDKPEDDRKWQLQRDPKALLGFSKSGNTAKLQNGSIEMMTCSSCQYKATENSENLLGFSQDGKTAIMGGQNEEALSSSQINFLSLLHLRHVSCNNL